MAEKVNRVEQAPITVRDVILKNKDATEVCIYCESYYSEKIVIPEALKCKVLCTKKTFEKFTDYIEDIELKQTTSVNLRITISKKDFDNIYSKKETN